MRAREEHRGWMRLCVRAWRAVVDHAGGAGRRVVWKGEGAPDELLPMTEVEESRAAVAAQPVAMTKKVRSGSRRGQVVEVTHETWWRRLRDGVRAIGMWAKVHETERRARGRWRKAVDEVGRAVRRAREERVQRAAEEVRARRREERGRAEQRAGRRRSGRLEQVEAPETYREARVRAQNGAGAEVARGQREAAAVWSTRGGMRLLRWMASGEGDASGPMSVGVRDDMGRGGVARRHDPGG